MKIVHAVESIDPRSGGPATSAPALALAQAQLGHDVTIVHYDSDATSRFVELGRASMPGFETSRLVAVDPAGVQERLFASRARRAFTHLAAEADVVHVHGIWRPFVFAAASSAIQQRCRLVIAPRGMLDPWSLEQRRWKKALALTFAWKRVLDSASFVHALNEAEAGLMHGLKLHCPIRIFPNGVFPAAYTDLPGSTEIYERFAQLRRRPYILFLGRLHYKKGIDYLIDAFALFARINLDTDLVIAGPDAGELAGLESRVAELDLRHRVHSVGPLFGRDKYIAYRGATCFCLPSRQEGFSMAILEALACGLPAVISHECHFPEVGDARAGEIVSLDPRQISAALLRLTGNAVRLAQARRAARELVFPRYDWLSIARNVTAGYAL